MYSIALAGMFTEMMMTGSAQTGLTFITEIAEVAPGADPEPEPDADYPPAR